MDILLATISEVTQHMPLIKGTNIDSNCSKLKHNEYTKNILRGHRI